MTASHWLAVGPELLLAGFACVLLLCGVFRDRPVSESSETKKGAYNFSTVWSMVALLICASWLFFVPPERGAYFSDMFWTSPAISFMKGLTLFTCAVVLLMSARFLEHQGKQQFEFPILILFSGLGMMTTISANNLMALYAGMELLSLPLYILTVSQRDSLRSSESGVKYFVLGALSSGILLYGSSLMYGATGTTDFAQIGRFLQHAPLSFGVQIALVFILSGLAFKISAVPFHMWTPDVYEGATTPVTAFFATAPKIAVFVLLFRVLFGPLAEVSDQWQDIVIVLSVGSMVLGAFAGIYQRNIKRLMAYSSIGHVGYILMGVAATSRLGASSGVFYLFLYLVMNLGTFACILSMRSKGRGSESRGQADPMEHLDALKGLSRNRPAMAFGLAILLFSLAGVPPLAGFFAKLYVFKAAIAAELLFLAVIGALSSVVAAFYYLRIVKLMYFDAPEVSMDDKPGFGATLIVFASSLGVVLFVFSPETLFAVSSYVVDGLVPR